MGIYDRDWYKDDAKQRFQSSPSQKAKREGKVRSKLEKYTESFSTTKTHRIGSNSFLTNILIWLGLGALCFALFTWASAPKVTVTGNQVEVVIPKSQDGHHYIDGVLNGKSIRFLIDTGASYVSIGGNIATELGLLSGKPTKFQTANGTVIGQLFDEQYLNVSGLATPALTVGVMPNAPNAALLGQNFLRHVELLQVDNKLVLRGHSIDGRSQNSLSKRAKSAMYAGLFLLFLAWLSSFIFTNNRRVR